ncbi:MAG: hypothetical protein ACOY3Y_05640 [Acidobacteriota bacterium]
MSLIGEALRKARAEAARREVQRDGVTIPPTIVGATRRPRGALSPVAVAAIALATALAGAALAWVLARGDRSPAASPTMAAETSAVARERDEQRSGVTPPTPVPASTARELPQTATPPDVTASAAKAQAPATTERTEPIASGRASTPESAPPAPANPEEQPAPGAERAFVLRAELGYATLELDYLVYRPGSPFGRVNGQDIVTGSTVAGFTVEEIGRDFIRLRDARGPLTLKVR